MKNLLSGKKQHIVWLAVFSLFLGGVSQAAGLFNTPSTGYVICVDSTTKVVTFPGTENCKKGQKKLILGAQGLKGDTGLQGVAGIVGATGPAGLNGTNGINGTAGPAGPAGEKGDTGPSEFWLTPADLVPSGLTSQHPTVTLEKIRVGSWFQYVVQIADSTETWNMVQRSIALPLKWRESVNVYATVYWSAEKTDGNIKMSIGYNGNKLGEVPGGPAFTDSSECLNTNPNTAQVIQSCTYRISNLIYKEDEISTIGVNRWGSKPSDTRNPDTNTGNLYIYGVKLELRN